MERKLMIRADIWDDLETRKMIATTALENNILHIFTKDEDGKIFSKLGKFSQGKVEDETFVMDGKKGMIISINSNEDVERAIERTDGIDIVAVSTENWKVIPLENLIASFRSTDTELFAIVRSEEETRLFLDILEVGVDGMIIEIDDPNTIIAVKKIMEEQAEGIIDLANGRISEIIQLGMGDRVCIDTCSMMRKGEGMLVGSSSSGLFLVHSESIMSEYADPRPFRVNAGPVHSYILMPDGQTRYLSELEVGDEALVVDRSGRSRKTIIGRVKIERRPLTLIKAEIDDIEKNIIIQNAETIRMISRGEPVSLVDLKIGDDILMRIDEGGRHFGKKVNETITEK